MSIAISAPSRSDLKSGARLASPNWARAVLLLVICGSVAAGFMATGNPAKSAAVARAGVELTNLLHAMAAIKAAMAALGALAILWRMRLPVTLARLACYLTACAAMSTGVGLIWNVAHIVSGAVLLHAGLLAAIVLLWRDPDVGARLAALVATRRAAVATLDGK